MKKEDMNIVKTTDYFHMTKEEAGQLLNCYNTREEAKILDSGLEVYFFSTLEGLEKDFHSQCRISYTEQKKYEVKLFEMVAPNSNGNKYAMAFV